MMVVGTADHYLQLRRKFPQIRHVYPTDWSLKEFGYFFVLDQLAQLGAKRVLEFGPGYSAFFANALIPRGIEYWCVDKPSNEGIAADAARWQAQLDRYQAAGAKMVQCFMGDFSPELPSEHFDAVFSVSVIEHIGDVEMKNTVQDLKRLLKPSGWSIQTIDMYHGSKKALVWHGHMVSEGFTVPPPHRHAWDLSGDHVIFIEPPKSRYMIFNSLGNSDLERSGPKFSSHFATTLHTAHL